MKLITYKKNSAEQLALVKDGFAFDVDLLDPRLPDTMNEFLESWEANLERLAACNTDERPGTAVGNLELLAPVPRPGSCRDAYAFRRHVAAARRNRGLEMLPEFDQYPVFYFTNHRSVQGPGKIACMPDHFQKLDFELEAAVVICKKGSDIPAREADSYIGGMMILNDISARTLQLEEMLMNLGPAKGKDFSTVTGPWLVTLDELADYEVPPPAGHEGKSWNLSMMATVNARQVCHGNLSTMDWTFAEIIERASYGATLYPGDIIGSGTVGGGCFLELNGTGRLADPAYREQWLQEGDSIKLAITGLGVLSSKIVRRPGDWSILARKKSPAK